MGKCRHNWGCAIDDTGVVCWGAGAVETTPGLSASTLVDAGGGHARAVDEGNNDAGSRGTNSVLLTRPVEDVQVLEVG